MNSVQLRQEIMKKFGNHVAANKPGKILTSKDFTAFKSNLPIQKNKRVTQPKKLSTMEDFCQQQHIFFTDKERIDYSISRSKHLFNDFRDSLNKGFKHLPNFEEHPGLSALLETEQTDQSVAFVSPVRSHKKGESKPRDFSLAVSPFKEAATGAHSMMQHVAGGLLENISFKSSPAPCKSPEKHIYNRHVGNNSNMSNYSKKESTGRKRMSIDPML